jgi:hypothetical protein
MRLSARVAVAAAFLWAGLIASTPAAASDIPSFREWIDGQDVALYVLDHAHSDWTVRREWLANDGECALAGTFRFRRLDQLQGRLPRTLTVRITSPDDCPGWWFINDPVAPPLGRWIVTDYGIRAWWHVRPTGRVDCGFGAGGPETFPSTLSGWYRALGLPDTATEPPHPASSDTAPLRGGVLAAAAVFGIVLWSRRRERRAVTTG